MERTLELLESHPDLALIKSNQILESALIAAAQRSRGEEGRWRVGDPLTRLAEHAEVPDRIVRLVRVVRKLADVSNGSVLGESNWSPDEAYIAVSATTIVLDWMTRTEVLSTGPLPDPGAPRPAPGTARRDGYALFVSYRREGGAATARLVRDALRARGVRAFLDVEDVSAERFDERLLRTIEETPNLLVVLSPGALDRCADERDWLRRELAHAIARRRNLVPLLLPWFAFPDTLPDDIAAIRLVNGIECSHAYFEATLDKIIHFLCG